MRRSRSGNPGALLRRGPLRTGRAGFPRIRLKQASRARGRVEEVPRPRCREDALPQTPHVVLGLAPINQAPVQDAALRSVHHIDRVAVAPNLPFGFGVVEHPISAGSPDPRGHPFGPGHPARYPAGYPEPPAEGPVSRSGFPSPFGVPALACWVILLPPGMCAFLTVGLPGHLRCPDPDGVTTFRTHETRPGRVPSRPRDGGAPTTDAESPAAACRFSAASPAPLHHNPSEGLNLTGHQRGFTCVHPSGLPLACDPRMERGSLGSSPELHTPPLPAAHVRAGTGLEHWPGTTQPTSLGPPICESTRNVRPRVAPQPGCW
jgi:hypothetical protein